MTSARLTPSSARARIRSWRAYSGSSRPGRSWKTNWTSPSVRSPVTGSRVACALGETRAMCSPTRVLSREDLPTLGRPARAMCPLRGIYEHTGLRLGRLRQGQQLPDHPCLAVELLPLLAILPGGRRHPQVETLGQPSRHFPFLLERPEGGAQGVFYLQGLFGLQAFGREGVSDVAAVAKHVSLDQLPEGAVAGRTSEWGRPAGAPERIAVFAVHDQVCLQFDQLGCIRPVPVAPLPGQPGQQRADVPDREPVIHRQVGQGAFRHSAVQGVFGVLDHGDPAARLDGPEAGAPVIQGSTQDDADHPGSVRPCGGPEEGIHRRPMAVLRGSVDHTDFFRLDQEMTIGGDDVYPSRLDRRVVVGRQCRKSALPGEKLGSTEDRSAGMWSTTNIAAGRSAGSWATGSWSASTPPADAPTTIMSRAGMAPPPVWFAAPSF